VTDEELVETRQYLVGVFPYTVQTTGEVAGRLEDLAVYDLPADYYDDYPAVLGRITRDEVHAAAQRHLDPEHLVIVAVGPADELHAQLEPFGPITVHEA
jgi:zinc protease